MKIVTISEAKENFSELINLALVGEDVVIAIKGKLSVKLVPYIENLAKREGGQLRGILKVSENFDDPLPDDLIKNFYKIQK